MNAQASLGARLDRIPTGRFHWRLAIAVGAGLFVDGFDIYLGSGVSAALVRQHIASLSIVATLAGVTVLGLAIGGIGAGMLADHLGRRMTLRCTMAIVVAGSLGAAFAPNMPTLILCRAIAALGLGGESVIGYAMLSEFLPPRGRGYWLGWIGLAANIGMPLALLIGAWVLPHPQGWRWMLALPAAAALPVLWLRRSLPESPRWLAARGRGAEADRIVATIEAPYAGTLPPPASGLPEAASPVPDGLFARRHRVRLVVAAAVNIGIISAVFGFVAWLPTFLASAGHSIASSALFSGLISLGNPLGVLLALLVVERVERKWSYIIASVVTILLGICYAMVRSDQAIVALGFLMVTAIYFAGTIGLTAYVPELFATSHRMRAIGISSGAGRVVAMLLPIAIVPMLGRFGQPGVIAMILMILAAQALVVARFGVRTTGRSLENI